LIQKNEHGVQNVQRGFGKMSDFIIKDYRIGKSILIDRHGNNCFIIAELGHNFGAGPGRLDRACAMIKRAAECGADAVKIQTRTNATLYTDRFYNAPYASESAFASTYGEHRKALELGVGEIAILQAVAQKAGIMLFSTAFDEEAATLLHDKFNMPAFKIASGSLVDFNLLKHIASFGKPMIVSTGGYDTEDVSRAVEYLQSLNAHFALLHCVAAYPVKPEDMNLRVISWMREAFPDVVIGLSDHYNGTVSAPIAYMLGARIIEKHFTLDHTWKGTDNAFSLEPEGFRKMVRDVRRTSIMLGDGIKKVLESEKAPVRKMARSPYAAHDILFGDVIDPEDVELKTPADGIAAWKVEKLVGKKAKKCFEKGEALST